MQFGLKYNFKNDFEKAYHKTTLICALHMVMMGYFTKLLFQSLTYMHILSKMCFSLQMVVRKVRHTVLCIVL